MGTLKGPYDAADWLTMLAIRKSVSYLKNKKENEQRRFVIKHEEAKLKDYLRRELTQEAA